MSALCLKQTIEFVVDLSWLTLAAGYTTRLISSRIHEIFTICDLTNNLTRSDSKRLLSRTIIRFIMRDGFYICLYWPI